jgi:Zn finger protein HypA/HybF involved in hydrogenase expression
MRPPDYCLFPFMCTSCEAASSLDIYSTALACEHCGSASVVPYGSAPALGVLGSTVIFGCPPCERFPVEQLTITDGTYWCPTCQKHSARFADSGILWD